MESRPLELVAELGKKWLFRGSLASQALAKAVDGFCEGLARETTRGGALGRDTWSCLYVCLLQDNLHVYTMATCCVCTSDGSTMQEADVRVHVYVRSSIGQC